METIYLDPKNPGSLGGVDRFRKAAGVTKAKAEAFLQELDEYSVNKERRKTFRRNRIVVTNLQQQYQMDLADLSKYSKQNKGVCFLLVAVDCFSKKASIQPLKNKTGPEVLKGIKHVFNEHGEPEKIQTDKGKEFYNKYVKDYLRDRDVILFSSENSDIKASMAENLIRTLKSRIWRLFRHRVSTVYIDKLQDIVHSYNHSVHSATEMKPVDVNQKNSLGVFNTLYADLLVKQKPKYSIGDSVRIAKEKGKFDKGYEYRFHEQVFTVDKVIRHPIPVYTLKEENGEPVVGKFYESELSKACGVDDKKWKIDKVIRKRGNKVLVRWLGYGREYDSWIDKSALE